MRGFGVLLLLAMSIPACKRDDAPSVAKTSKDGASVKAEARSQERVATIELERRTPEVTDELPTEQLRLYTLDRSESATLLLATGEAAASTRQHRLQFGPTGERIAYQVEDEPWAVVYLFPPSLAVHAAETYAQLDWRKVPAFEDAFVALYDAQRDKVAGGIFDATKSSAMVRWVKEERSSTQLAPLLVALLTLENVEAWASHFEQLEDTGKARVRADLRKLVTTPEARPNHFRAAWSTAAIDLTEETNAEVVRRGAEVLGTDDATLRGEAKAAAAYLKALRARDESAAQTIGCQILRGAKPAHLALEDGRPLAVALEEQVTTNPECADH